MLIDDSTFIRQGLDASHTFANLTQEEKTLLASKGVLCHYAANTTVFSADHPGDAFYLVISGILLIRLKNHKLKECHAGQVFGEVSIFDDHTRMGTIHVQEAAILAKFDQSCIIDESVLPATLRAKLIQALTQQIISYLYNDLPVSSRSLMEKGESDTIEFKNSAHKVHLPKIVETLAAMMNAQGGTILLGVEDGGGLTGVKLTNTQRDVLVRKINMLVHDQLGEYPNTLVSVDAEVIDGREIIRIDCDPSATPVFLTENGEEAMFVRLSRQNTQIRTLRDCIQYIKKRFT